MPESGKTAVIADEATLGTVCPPGWEPEGFVAIQRSRRTVPAVGAGAIAQRGITRAIVLGPVPGEGEALAATGIKCVAWLTDPSARAVTLEPFSAVVSTDVSAASAQDASKWRLEPLPVADFLFAEGLKPEIERVFFDGPTSQERDRFLQPVKHHFDVLHLVSGASPEALLDLIGRCQAAIDLLEYSGMTRRDRIGPAIAAGLLVLAQAPVDRPGMFDGEHFKSFESPEELELLTSDAFLESGSFLEIRRNAREFAERLRASTCIPRVAGYLG